MRQQIARWQTGDKVALDEMLPAVYDELRRLARIYLSRRAGHSLQPTELVNEAYMAYRAAASGLAQPLTLPENRRAGIAARAVARYRGSRCKKKGEGYVNRVSLDAALANVEKDAAVDIMVLDRSMEHLARVEERQAKVVELRVIRRPDGGEYCFSAEPFRCHWKA